MNRLYAIEGGMSLTGSRADVRIPMRPSALARIAFALVRAVHLQGGRALPRDWRSPHWNHSLSTACQRSSLRG